MNPNTGPTQCHDITVYPAIGLAGGACGGYGLAARHPRSGASQRDSPPFPIPTCPTGTRPRSTTMARRSCSATSGAAVDSRKCRATDKKEWGADALFTIVERQAARSRATTRCRRRKRRFENCVAHNGSLMPIPGPRRDGSGLVPGRPLALRLDGCGASAARSRFFDRGPIDSDATRRRRIVVGVLVQRRHRELRDRTRPRCRGADAERVHLAKRDRRGQDGASWPTSTRRANRDSFGLRASRSRAHTSTSSSVRRHFLQAKSPMCEVR